MWRNLYRYCVSWKWLYKFWIYSYRYLNKIIWILAQPKSKMFLRLEKLSMTSSTEGQLPSETTTSKYLNLSGHFPDSFLQNFLASIDETKIKIKASTTFILERQIRIVSFKDIFINFYTKLLYQRMIHKCILFVLHSLTEKSTI